MSPRVENRFAGSHYMDDPRTLIFAAAGCIFPTTPPYKWRLKSTNATVFFAGLNGDGLLVELTTPQPAHADTLWELASPDDEIETLTVRKQRLPEDRPGYRYTVDVKLYRSATHAVQVILRTLSRCNVNVRVGSIGTDDIDHGVTGSTFKMWQVEFDKRLPP